MKALSARSRIIPHHWAASLAMLVSLACASVQTWTASPSDYHDYRSFRLTGGELERLAAAQEYLLRHPNGNWREEVGRWYTSNEQRFLDEHWDDARSLNRYARRMRDPKRRAQVTARVAALNAFSRNSQQEDKAFLVREARRRQELDAAKERRAKFLTDLRGWLSLLAKAREYGRPRSEWDPQLERAFFGPPSPGTCSAANCEKTLLFEYDLPTKTGLQTHGVGITIELELIADQLVASQVAGNRLFAAVVESSSLSRLEDSSAAFSNRDYVAWWLAELQNLGPAADCGAHTAAPTPAEDHSLICSFDGLTITFLHNEESSHDRVRFSRP